MKPKPITLPTEQQSLEALTQFREALTSMGQLQRQKTLACHPDPATAGEGSLNCGNAMAQSVLLLAYSRL